MTNAKAPREQREARRGDFPYTVEIATRWSDFDMLRHLNNVQYYRFFEYIILDHLAGVGSDLLRDRIIPFTVESRCHFQKPVGMAGAIDAGLRVVRVGNSSVRYEIALFEKGRDAPSAFGRVAQVYLDRDTEKSTAIPESVRKNLEKICAGSESDSGSGSSSSSQPRPD